MFAAPVVDSSAAMQQLNSTTNLPVHAATGLPIFSLSNASGDVDKDPGLVNLAAGFKRLASQSSVVDSPPNLCPPASPTRHGHEIKFPGDRRQQRVERASSPAHKKLRAVEDCFQAMRIIEQATPNQGVSEASTVSAESTSTQPSSDGAQAGSWCDAALGDKRRGIEEECMEFERDSQSDVGLQSGSTTCSNKNEKHTHCLSSPPPRRRRRGATEAYPIITEPSSDDDASSRNDCATESGMNQGTAISEQDGCEHVTDVSPAATNTQQSILERLRLGTLTVRLTTELPSQQEIRALASNNPPRPPCPGARDRAQSLAVIPYAPSPGVLHTVPQSHGHNPLASRSYTNLALGDDSLDDEASGYHGDNESESSDSYNGMFSDNV